jgi:hypothetical protein
MNQQANIDVLLENARRGLARIQPADLDESWLREL